MTEIEEVRRGLAKTGLSAAAVCGLCGVAPSRLSDALNQHRSLDPAILRRMLHEISRVERALLLMKPLKLDFSNHTELSHLLDELEYLNSEFPVVQDVLLLMRLLSGVDAQILANEAGIPIDEMRKAIFDSGVKFHRAAESLKGIAAEIQNAQAK